MLNGAKFHINEPFIDTKRPAGSFHHLTGSSFICVTDVFWFIELGASLSFLSCLHLGPRCPPALGFVFKSLATTLPGIESLLVLGRHVQASDC